MKPKSSIINTFRNLKLHNKIPSNFLLIGPNSDLKNVIPYLAQLIVCPQNTNCPSNCPFCTNIRQQSYEHFLILEPQENVIKISDLDVLFDWAQYCNDTMQPKVYWISQIEKMTKEASNKILKFLENSESPHFGILTTDNPERLLLTVRSRLQIFYHRFHLRTDQDWQQTFGLTDRDYHVLKNLNQDVYFVNDEFIEQKFLPIVKLMRLFWTNWEQNSLEELYLWDKTELKKYFWFFLECLIIDLNQLLWQPVVQKDNNRFAYLYQLLTFSQKIWERQQRFALSVPGGGNVNIAFLFWLNQIVSFSTKIVQPKLVK